MASHPVEPLVTAHCRSYGRLNPPYDFVGSPSGVMFGWIQRVSPPRPPNTFGRELMDFEVTDFSDGTRYLWREDREYAEEYNTDKMMYMSVSVLGGAVVGRAECNIARPHVLLQRDGFLWTGLPQHAVQPEPAAASDRLLVHPGALAAVQRQDLQPRAARAPLGAQLRRTGRRALTPPPCTLSP
jgi:hypothetical protein